MAQPASDPSQAVGGKLAVATPATANGVPPSNRHALSDPPETQPASGSTEEPDERHAAITNGLRWTMIGRPVIEAANLLGVAVLARLVAPRSSGDTPSR